MGTIVAEHQIAERPADEPGPTLVLGFDPSTVTLEEFPLLVARHEARSAALALVAARLGAEGQWSADGTLSMTAGSSRGAG